LNKAKKSKKGRKNKMKLFWYTSFLIIALATRSLGAVPWKYTPTSVSHSISLAGAAVTVDNQALETGDVVGVFYDSSGVLACGGYAVWPSAQLIAYGNDASMGDPNGFSLAGSGETFKFKIWKQRANCVVDSGTIIQFLYQPPTFNDSIYFQPNGTSRLVTLNGARKQVSYSKESYCTGDTDPIPTRIGELSDLVFSSQAGLVLNTSTGAINIAASTPGTYTVYFHTDRCLRSGSARIKIKMHLDNLHVEAQAAGCTEKGQIRIRPESIVCGQQPYEYRLRNIITGAEMVSAQELFEEVQEGTYELFVKDFNNEERRWYHHIVISKECEDLIIAPYSPDNRHTTLHIPQQGQARIYDRFGLLKREISIPADWDGTDNSGSLLPMGQYVIICNEDEHIVVNIIK
jgi:hypothetical protein